MSTVTVEPVKHSVLVEVPAERAFEVFTAGFASWWPLDTHHIGEKPAETAVLEPRAGGRWFERAADGSECNWGFVTAWEPPRRIVLAWHLTADWQFDPDADKASEVEVRFDPEGPGATRVELEHRLLERFGPDADRVRESVSSTGGWPGLLEIYAKAAA
jgi:uncharacterized protein YndB with AHSA1/START domain